MKLTTLMAAAVSLALVACGGANSPELRVIGIHDGAPREVVFVQVTNPASHPMRLTKLDYTFAADNGKRVGEGEVELSREVPAGTTTVVEVPFDEASDAAAGPITLTGTLTTELDRMIRSFDVQAKLVPQSK